MRLTPTRQFQNALFASLATLTLVAGCSSPQPPAPQAAPPADRASNVWPAPAAPLDDTTITPVETAGAAANA